MNLSACCVHAVNYYDINSFRSVLEMAYTQDKPSKTLLFLFYFRFALKHTNVN